MVVFPKVEGVPWLGDGGAVHFLQFVGALAGNLDDAIWAFPVRHELLLLTFEEHFPEDKFVRHEGTCPNTPVEAPGYLLLVSSKLDPGRFSVLFGQIFVGSQGCIILWLAEMLSTERRKTCLDRNNSLHAEGQ